MGQTAESLTAFTAQLVGLLIAAKCSKPKSSLPIFLLTLSFDISVIYSCILMGGGNSSHNFTDCLVEDLLERL